ncbi:hypothetical protein WMF28_12330 [Sorangium sp. So ce590]|uniref:hypothetical protein n=1 Tax=Sorangium sp. So ce590 TaxID=3133317 RepID=UPI003F60C89E
MRKTRIGDLPFTLVELMCETADTVIYRPRRDADGTPVTIKVVKGEHPGQRHVAQLRHELEISRHLNLDSVVRADRLESIPGGAALVMEYFAGVPLDKLACPLPPPRR